MALNFKHDDSTICRILFFLERILNETGDNNDTTIEHNQKTENNSKQIAYRINTPESNRLQLTLILIKRIEFRGIEIIPIKRKNTIKFQDIKTGLNVIISIKPSHSKRCTADPFEPMVACLLYTKITSIPSNCEEMDILIDEMLTHKSKIKNADVSIFNNFRGSYTPLLQAISASNVIKKNINFKRPDNIFLTGHSFPPEIKFLDIPHLGMKNYNSSDLVLQYDDFYYCISLKKTEDIKNLPTLINKSVDTLFESDVNTSIEKHTNNFFNKIVSNKLKIKSNSSNWRQYIHKIDNKQINALSKGQESHFNHIFKHILNLPDDVIMEILNMVFKIDLKTKIKGRLFEFALVTGQGVYDKWIHIWEGDIITLNDFNRLINKLLLSNPIKIKPAKNKKQCFEKDAPAFKIFFDVFIGDLCVLYIEIRYKGVFTIQPQLTAYLSEELKKYGKKNVGEWI